VDASGGDFMPIYQGLDGFRVRVGASPTYVHSDCKQPLRRCGDLQGRGQQNYILKCDACNRIVGEWPTVDEMNLELVAWFEANAA
jgi:hypothetical protein